MPCVSQCFKSIATEDDSVWFKECGDLVKGYWGDLSSLGRLRNRLGKRAGMGDATQQLGPQPRSHHKQSLWECDCSQPLLLDTTVCTAATDSSGQHHWHRITAMAATHCQNTCSPKLLSCVTTSSRCAVWSKWAWSVDLSSHALTLNTEGLG